MPTGAVFGFFCEHFLPVLVWGSLYACRCEVGIFDQVIGTTGRQVLWVSTAVLAVVINGGVQNWVIHSGDVNEVGNDYTRYVDDWPLAASVTGILILPWASSALL